MKNIEFSLHSNAFQSFLARTTRSTDVKVHHAIYISTYFENFHKLISKSWKLFQFYLKNTKFYANVYMHVCIYILELYVHPWYILQKQTQWRTSKLIPFNQIESLLKKMRTQYSSQKPRTPSQNHHSIETFIDLVQHDNEVKILNTKRSKDNLTKGEQRWCHYHKCW